MAIKNNQAIDLETLKKKLERDLPKYKYEINGNALTVSSSDKTKLNIVEMGEEFWTVEAVPFNFKIMVVIFCLAFIAFWVQQQGWHWGVNISLYAGAFVVLGYFANWFYGFLYQKSYQAFKPKVVAKVKEIVG